ncbi:MAG: ParB/RepB/Spo0J family partition protein [Acidimicrobiia bacterium]
MTTRRGGLGRGLEALIPTRPEALTGYANIPVEQIEPNPNQPRTRFEEEALANLADSIREVGVLQPISVMQLDTGAYRLIAGERRLRAAKRAGLAEIPAVIRTVDDQSSLTEALIENIQRENLSPLEEAAAYNQLLEEHGLTHEEIGVRVGRSRVAVTNSLRLLTLSAAIQGMLERGELSAGHARALLGVEDRKYAEHIAERAVSEGWSVRQVEEAARARREIQEPEQANRQPLVREVRPVEIVELEHRLTDQLGTKVKIEYRNKKGKIEIGFGSLDDLERLYRHFFS